MTTTPLKRGRAAALNIKNPETYQLIRQLADETGETMTQAVTVAVQERLSRVHDKAGAERAQRQQELQALIDRLASRFREPFRSLDHGEWLYDDNGLPK